MPDEQPAHEAKAIFDAAAEIASRKSEPPTSIAYAAAIEISGRESTPCFGP